MFPQPSLDCLLLKTQHVTHYHIKQRIQLQSPIVYFVDKNKDKKMKKIKIYEKDENSQYGETFWTAIPSACSISSSELQKKKKDNVRHCVRKCVRKCVQNII